MGKNIGLFQTWKTNLYPCRWPLESRKKNVFCVFAFPLFIAVGCIRFGQREGKFTCIRWWANWIYVSIAHEQRKRVFMVFVYNLCWFERFVVKEITFKFTKLNIRIHFVMITAWICCFCTKKSPKNLADKNFVVPLPSAFCKECTYICSISQPNCDLERDLWSNLNPYWSCALAQIPHNGLMAVAGLAENMVESALSLCFRVSAIRHLGNELLTLNTKDHEEISTFNDCSADWSWWSVGSIIVKLDC